jgi:hypothetical protein
MVTLGLSKKWAESDLVVGVSMQLKEIWLKYQIVINSSIVLAVISVFCSACGVSKNVRKTKKSVDPYCYVVRICNSKCPIRRPDTEINKKAQYNDITPIAF